MPFCRVILPNGSSNVIMLESGKIIREVLQTCCSRQNFVLSAYDVRVDDEKKVAPLGFQFIFLAILCANDSRL